MNDTGLPGVTLDDCEHVCVFYRGAQERDTVLSAFFGAGYAEGDKCLCIADDQDVTAVADRLDPQRRSAPGQLTVPPRLKAGVSASTHRAALAPTARMGRTPTSGSATLRAAKTENPRSRCCSHGRRWINHRYAGSEHHGQ